MPALRLWPAGSFGKGPIRSLMLAKIGDTFDNEILHEIGLIHFKKTL
jgi:hypothetical protein